MSREKKAETQQTLTSQQESQQKLHCLDNKLFMIHCSIILLILFINSQFSIQENFVNTNMDKTNTFKNQRKKIHKPLHHSVQCKNDIKKMYICSKSKCKQIKNKTTKNKNKKNKRTVPISKFYFPRVFQILTSFSLPIFQKHCKGKNSNNNTST